MEALYVEDNFFHKILYDREGISLRQEIKEVKSKLLSPVSGVIEKVDSNNTEIIIKSCEGHILFLYLNEKFINEPIISFVKEGDLIFKGEIILDIRCGYVEEDLTIINVVN